MANTDTCAKVMAICAQRMGMRKVEWVALGRKISAMVDKMEGSDPETIADDVLAEALK